MKPKILALAILGLVVMNVNAVLPPLPAHCNETGVNFQNQIIILNAQNQPGTHIYRLQNIGAEVIQVNHPSNAGMQAGWASDISVNHLSAILINQGNFVISCAYLKPQGIYEPVSCKNVIGVCEMTNLTYSPSAAQGAYWIAENRAINSFNTALVQRGFSPAA